MAFTPLPSRAFHGRVGLLGGAFNPPHQGHLHLSQEAIKRLNLDAVWWLVSPDHPFKPGARGGNFSKRLKAAQVFTQNTPHILASDLEGRLHTSYTIDTIRSLQKRYPRIAFLWLMGADNLVHFHRWKHWQALAQLVPIAVFDRKPSTYPALKSRAAYALPDTNWQYHFIRPNFLSSTALRR